MAQRLVLGDERGCDVLRDHEPGVEPFLPCDEEWRQPVGQARVDEALGAALADAGQLGARDREAIEAHRDRLSVEVPVGDDQLLVEKDERVVGRRVELDRDRSFDVREQIAARAVDLRCAAQRVRVLHLVAPAVPLDDRRPLEQRPQRRRTPSLPGERPRRLDRRMEALRRALERLQRHRARNVGGAGESIRPDERERGHRGHELRAVDQGEAFLCGEPIVRDRRHAVPRPPAASARPPSPPLHRPAEAPGAPGARGRRSPRRNRARARAAEPCAKH